MAVPRGSERVVVATMGAVRSVAVGAAVWMAAVQAAVVVEMTILQNQEIQIQTAAQAEVQAEVQMQ